MTNLYPEYLKLFNSNTGDVLVESSTGHFNVIKHLIVYKCPLLEKDIWYGKLLMIQYSHIAVSHFFLNLYCHDTDLDDLTQKECIDLYQLCKKYNLKDYKTGNSFADTVIEHIESYFNDPHGLLILLMQETEAHTLFNLTLKRAKDKLFNYRKQCKKSQTEMEFLHIKLEQDKQRFVKEFDDVSKLPSLLQKLILGKEQQEEKKEDEIMNVTDEKEEDDEVTIEEEYDEMINQKNAKELYEDLKKQMAESSKSSTTLPTPPHSPKKECC